MNEDKLIRQSKNVTQLLVAKKIARARQSTEHLLHALSKTLMGTVRDTPPPQETDSITSQLLGLAVGTSLEISREDGITIATHRNRLNSIITYVRKQQPGFRYTVRSSEKGFLIWKRALTPERGVRG